MTAPLAPAILPAPKDVRDMLEGLLGKDVTVSPEVGRYCVALTRATREHEHTLMGASPRGSLALMLVGRAYAVIRGRDYVTPDDVKALARSTLRHRVQLRPEADLEGATADGVLEGVLTTVPAPR